MVSLLHGIVLVVFSTYHFYSGFESCGDPNTDYESNLIYFSISYFFYDFVAMAYYGLLDGTMVFHHLIVIMLMTQPYYAGTGSNYVVRGMFMTEISNPFMHLRCILKHYGLRYTLAYEFCEIVFSIAYPFGRIFIGTNMLYTSTICPYISIGLKIGFWGLYLQSLYFTFQMISILKKRSRDIHNRGLQRIEFKWFTPPLDAELEKLGITNKKGDKGVNL